MLRIIFLLLITSASFGQVLQETNGSRAENRIVHKLGFRLPQVCWVTGNPNLLNYSAFMSKGAMVYDTCAGKIKRWSGSAWISIQDSTAGGGGGDYVDTIYRKAGQDSIFYTINGGSERAVKDSVGSGGGGVTGSGAANQLAFFTSATNIGGSDSLKWDRTTRTLNFNNTANYPWNSAVVGVLQATSVASSRPAGVLISNAGDGGFFTNYYLNSSAQNVRVNASTSSSLLYAAGDGDIVLRTSNFADGSPFTWKEPFRIRTAATPQPFAVLNKYLKFGTGGASETINTWSSAMTMVTESAAGAIWSTTSYDIGLSSNAFFSASNQWTYKATRVAADYYMDGNGNHNWRTAPSGAANTAITHTTRMFLGNTGKLGVGTSSPAASSIVDITSTTTGFLKPRMTSTQRNAISSPAAGLSVYNSSLATNDVYTTAWYQQPNGLSGSGTLDFPSTGAHSSSDLTITVTGAAVGDIVILGTPVQDIDGTFTAFVSAANTVTVRFNHYGSGNSNPASGDFKVYVIKN